MYLKSIKINNYRRFVEAECFLNPGLNLIVGPNDSGKTAFIDAIRLVLKQIVDDYFRVDKDDFNDSTKEINIDLIFSFDDFGDDERLKKEAGLFAEYLSFNEENKPEIKVWYSVKYNDDDIKYPEFKVGPTKDVAVDMDARCRENFKIVYLKPLRDAENELKAKQGSRISKIFNKHKILCEENNKKELIDCLKQFQEKVQDFFNKEDIKEIKEKISGYLDKFDEQGKNKNIKISPTEYSNDSKKIEQNFLRILEKISLYYDKDTLKKPGLGTMNLIFIAAELLHLELQLPPKMLLIEEIEAHLHPQRQLKIIKALQEESKNGIQMILTTHSPNLASVINVERLNICHDGVFYTLAKGSTKLENNNYSYLGRFLDVTKANLFFAQGVILVEGPTEQLLISEFAKILGYDLTDFGISVISVNSLGFDNFVNIFKRLKEPYNKIPIAIITDADKKNSKVLKKYEDGIKSVDNKIGCFIGEQMYSSIDISKNKSTTFEKLILGKTLLLKKLYIDIYNDLLKKKRSKLNSTMSVEYLYSRIEKKKAIIAQRLAEQLSQIDTAEKEAIKSEIKTYLKYIADAIKFVVPPELNQAIPTDKQV